MDLQMDVEIVGKFLSTLPEDDDHPYRTGPWRPQTTEWDADDLTAVEGEIPRDLDGIYLRNTENPLHPAFKTYHPFDGDGMMHVVGFRDGKAFYRNRFIRTDGFLAENEAGGPLWPGLAEPVQLAEREQGWGARTLMKDASSTDVIVHRGIALTSFYQCGDLYRIDPYSADTLGKETWNGGFPFDWGVSAHPEGRQQDRRTAVLQLQQARPLHALRRRRREQRAGALRRHPAARSAAAARHGVHRKLRDPQRFPVVLGSAAAGARCASAAVLSGHSVALRGASAPGLDRRYPVVRGGPDVRAALHQRLRGRRRDRARRLLRGRSAAAGHRVDQVGQAVSLPGAGSPADPAAPVAVQPGHRRGERGAAVASPSPSSGPSTPIMRRAPTATPTPRPGNRAGSCSTGWSNTTCSPAGRKAIRSATASTAARPRWRRGWAAPPRTTATWSR